MSGSGPVSGRCGGREPDLAPLTAVIFAAAAADVRNVVIGGRDVVVDGRHVLIEDVPAELSAAVRAVLRLTGSVAPGLPACRNPVPGRHIYTAAAARLCC